MKRINLLILILFTATLNSAHSKILEFETTRLKSTAGAGVGSLLVEEATLLNPASISFFQVSSLYIQKTGTETSRSNNENVDSDAYSFIASDTKGALKGSLSYFNEEVNGATKKQIGFSAASPISKTSAMGFGARRTISKDASGNESEYTQMVVGVTHSVNQNLSLGIVAFDPLKNNDEDTLAIVGLHYSYDNFIDIMLDGGADYTRELSQTSLYRAAAQLRVMNDFFLRFGAFEDKGNSEKGTGAGLGWVQPRLTMEVAIKNTELLTNEERSVKSDVKETSFSLSYRF